MALGEFVRLSIRALTPWRNAARVMDSHELHAAVIGYANTTALVGGLFVGASISSMPLPTTNQAVNPVGAAVVPQGVPLVRVGNSPRLERIGCSAARADRVAMGLHTLCVMGSFATTM
jgi:hypothetical protein